MKEHYIVNKPIPVIVLPLYMYLWDEYYIAVGFGATTRWDGEDKSSPCNPDQRSFILRRRIGTSSVCKVMRCNNYVKLYQIINKTQR